MSSSRRNGSGSGGNSDSRPPILIPTIYSESEMRQIPCGTTRTGLTLPTPYDCRYRNDEYLDRHREYARCGKNVNATNDSSRLTSVAGQDPESIGYYDRYDRLIQHEHVSSTSSECWLIVVARSLSRHRREKNFSNYPPSIRTTCFFISPSAEPHNHERGSSMPQRIYGLRERINHPASSCRWDPRR